VSQQKGEPVSDRQESTLITTPREYFEDLIDYGIKSRRIDTQPIVRKYLVDLMEHFLETRNLYEEPIDELGQKRPQTLAELYLQAQNSENHLRFEMLKKLGDRALYISGYFGDSFNKKIIDVDYYANLGGAAYGTLSSSVKDDLLAKVYGTFSRQFLDFVDVLTVASQKSMIKTDQNLLRLYERYLKTGSELAKSQLIEAGVVTYPQIPTKVLKQS
jgi:hypothetical protein